ncbi:MAG: CHASE2 domain-containing protein [Bdellovibrionales bacterium]|nr:CHASE2 domain-containing protein [Bdellovibrionales bacterium]
MKRFLKKHLWMLSIPFIATAALFQLTFDLGEQGKLQNTLLREKIYPIARSLNGTMTNIKFRARGPEPVKNNIVIVDADDASVEMLGRWPWHREVYGSLIHTLLSKMKVKYLGLDVAFSEPEERIPAEVYDLIQKSSPQLLEDVRSFEGDPLLAQVFSAYKDRIVTGESMTVGLQPAYATKDELEAVTSIDNNKRIEEMAGKFALADEIPLSLDVIQKSPLMYIIEMIANIPVLHDAAKYSGLFNAQPDPDGYIRRYQLFMINGKKIYPSLALQLAALAKQDQIKINFTSDARVERMYFSKTPDESIPVTNLGCLDLNFRGPSRSFKYISAAKVMRAAEDPAETEIHDALRDAVVLFGVSAIGLYDMRAFPFDTNTAGVEGHATALDNLLSNDSLRSATGIKYDWLPLALIIGLGLIFAVLFSRFEAVPSLLIFIGFAGIFGAIDVKVLFEQYINIPTAFLFLETVMIFMFILAVRYWIEEQDKKAVRDVFSHYLAPSVVDMVLKDPEALQVGGDRKEISILFSDLAGFTTLSEGLEPKVLAQFLNEYLSEMTDIVFEYGGTLDKYIGDAVMAFWGAPIHQNDHAIRACMAAKRMQERLLEIAPIFKEKYGVEVGVRIGVNSGVVIVGNMGSKKIMEYTVIGDHVNLASRLEGLNSLYDTKILTSRNSLEMISEEDRKKLPYRIIDSVKVKGKNQAVDIIQIAVTDLHESIIEMYYLGRDAFRQRNWDEAEKFFKKCIELHEKYHGSSDTVAETFLERVETYRITPPPEKWDGTVEMRTK